jgi:aminopeptidase N
MIKWENGNPATPLEFNSMPGDILAIKEDFIVAELSNSVRYFQNLFGKYPYESYSAVFHPYRFGQGFATMLTIPNTDRANKYTYAFISHETAHQWWGNIVAWRSYRDQWLSEGFAEYSGVLYTGIRDSRKASSHLIDDMRRSLKDPPMTPTGPGKGKLVDVGPIILGRRLESRKTVGAYSALVYNKGGLVLRMLHFLLTDPVSGDGKAFFEMMKDFVNRYRDKVASTDDFRLVANEHFARSPVAKRYGLRDLNWFFRQWVYDTALPSYRLEYEIRPQSDGTSMVTGNVIQENVSEQFFMPLPLIISFAGDQIATGTVSAYGPKTPFSIKLPKTPQSAELDPQRWVLSERTATK